MNRIPPLAAIALLALAAPGCEDTLAPGDAVISEPFEIERDATLRSAFEVTGINGNITVTGDGTSETFRATGFRRVRNCTESEAEAWIDRLEVRATETADVIALETVQPLDTSPCSLEVEYELTVPARLAADLVNINGNIVVMGLAGGLSVTNTNGNVTLDGSAGPATVRLTNGNILADVLIAGTETADLLTVNGNVGVLVPTSTSASLSASLVNGVIDVANLSISDRVQTRTTLTGTLGTGEGTILLGTTNGNITITGTL